MKKYAKRGRDYTRTLKPDKKKKFVAKEDLTNDGLDSDDENGELYSSSSDGEIIDEDKENEINQDDQFDNGEGEQLENGVWV